MRKFRILIAALAVAGVTAPVLAHHGFDTEYDGQKHIKVEGVVTMVAWTNPHMRVYVDVKDKLGKVTNWNFELTSPNTIRRQGWGPEDLQSGDEVIVEGYAGKVVETRASLASIMKKSDMKPLFGAGGPDAAQPVKQ
jgi:hypothetical protein